MTITRSSDTHHQNKNKIRLDITEHSKKIEQLNTAMKQLSTIETLADKEIYTNLQAAFAKNRTTLLAAITHLSMAKQTLADMALASLLNKTYQETINKKPREAEKYNNAYIQQKLQWSAQNSLKYDAAFIRVPINFEEKIQQQKTLAQIKDDIKKMLLALAPQVCVTKTNDGQVVEEKIKGFDELKEKHIDAIFIMGNNDLKQVNHAAAIYQHLKNENRAPHKIYVSGCGGHGTVPGYIFGSSEAEAIAQRLKDLGVSENIITLEKEAVDSKQNIDLIIPSMHKDSLKSPISCILLSGTPAAVLRQLRLFEKRALYPWKQLLACPPSPDEFDQLYNDNEIDTLINVMYLLRETATLLACSITSPYMSNRLFPDEAGLKECIVTLVDYYNILTGNKLNGQHLAEKYLDFTHLLADCNTDAQITEKQKDFAAHVETKHLADVINETAHYFRLCFEAIEREYIQIIRPYTAEKCHPQTQNEIENVARSLKVQAAILNEQEKKTKEKSLSKSVNALIDSPFALKKAQNKFPAFFAQKTEPRSLGSETLTVNRYTR